MRHNASDASRFGAVFKVAGYLGLPGHTIDKMLEKRWKVVDGSKKQTRNMIVAFMENNFVINLIA